MKIFLALLSMCAPLLGADSSIRVTTTITTNVLVGSIHIDEVFTRGAQTNLTRHTEIASGRVPYRMHRFYHGGRVLADIYWTAPPRSDDVGADFKVYPGSPYFVKLAFGPSNQITSASIFTEYAVIIDSFSCTNGVFFPDDASRIAEINEKRKKK